MASQLAKFSLAFVTRNWISDQRPEIFTRSREPERRTGRVPTQRNYLAPPPSWGVCPAGGMCSVGTPPPTPAAGAPPAGPWQEPNGSMINSGWRPARALARSQPIQPLPDLVLVLSLVSWRCLPVTRICGGSSFCIIAIMQVRSDSSCFRRFTIAMTV
jgi:hypothetical protein